MSIASAKAPSLPTLGVDDEYGEVVTAGGATLVSSGAVVLAAGSTDGEYQEDAEQKANGQITKAKAPVLSLLFLFHNYSSLDFVAYSHL